MSSEVAILDLRDENDATLVSLNDRSVAFISTYAPSSPVERPTEVESQQDGNDVSHTTLGNVTEAADLILRGCNVTEVQAWLLKLGRAFTQARERQKSGVGGKVYIVYHYAGEEGTRRSEVLVGRYDLDPDWVTQYLRDGLVKCQVSWTRRFYWENNNLYEAMLYSEFNGIYQTGGVDVDNCDDTTRGNWVEIADGTLGGDLHMPLYVSMRNTTVSTTMGRVYVGVNWRSDPANLQTFYEGENALGGVSVASMACSNNACGRFTWAGAALTELAVWDLTNEQLDAWGGNYARVIARVINNAYSDLYLTVKVRFDATVIQSAGAQLVDSTYELNDMGSIRIPPWIPDQTIFRMLKLVLYGQRATAGVHTLDLDYLALMPVDSWQFLETVGAGGIPTGGRLTLDGPREEIYSHWITPDPRKMGNWVGTPPFPIEAEPGHLVRLHFLRESVGGGAQAWHQMKVEIYRRGRWRTI